jgi:DNA-binding MurR/RpiR family transcriptional regulator
MRNSAQIDYMLSNAAITKRIAKIYPSLTDAHRKAADFVLTNPFQAATMTIDELADAVGMSVATANRFARALEFDGYPQFRAELVKAFETTLAPVEKLRTELQREASSAEIFAAYLDETMDNIQGTRSKLNPVACERAVNLILQAKRIYILGFSTSAYLGSIMAHLLDPCCPTVQTVADDGGPSHAARRLFKLDREDLVIAISFPRYTRFTVELASVARERGAQLLALTDSPASPLVPMADVALYAKTDRRLASNSETAALALIEALCDAVVHRSKNSLRNATELTEHFLPYLYVKSAPQEKTAVGARKKARKQ